MKNNQLIYVLLLLLSLNFSCKEYLEIDPPKGSLVQSTVFNNDDQATSVVTGIYAIMSAGYNFASGDNSGVSILAGLSGDDLLGYDPGNVPFYENQIAPANPNLQTLYASAYRCIYAANSVLNGLDNKNEVTPPVKAQLEGEAKFIRAFTYFYLVNLFGPVPLNLSTDYKLTQVATRASVDDINVQILSDLKSAESLLAENYPTTERVRPNKSAAQALLARVYLYNKNYANAESYASLLIGKTATYNLVTLDAVFLANSPEAIWQLMPPSQTNTLEGTTFILQLPPSIVSLRNDFALNGFEPNDKRQSEWIGNYADNTGTYYYASKYKVFSSSTVTEYSMVLRLGEQYLIRAEARINQGKIDLGIADLNTIRARARPQPTSAVPNPLPILPLTLDKATALLAVEQERKVELFSEWGHRWLDLKRTGRATDVLSPLKLHWQETDILYPIPQAEINTNPNITQNSGY